MSEQWRDQLIDPLIDVQQLWNLLRSSTPPVLIGVLPRWRFALQRLPGSLRVWRPDISQPDGASLLGRADFERWACRMGLHPDSHVVVWDVLYDAPRLWWALKHYGMGRVQVLDGGLQAWIHAGFPVERGSQERPRHLGTFRATRGDHFPMAERAMVLRSRTPEARIQLWDTRDQEEWEGRRRLRGARRPGRIPWAKPLNWRLFRRGAPADNRFRSSIELQALVDSVGLDPSQRQIFYCQSGVRTTTAILALVRLGWDPKQLYNDDRSWRQWSRETLPPA